MDNLELGIDILMNTPQVKTDTEKVKSDIKGVGQTAEQTAAKVGANIQAMTKALPEAAGKAKKEFNGLQNSINQISRELPAFTYSAQTGFMAVANNIPMLFDEIGRLSKANKELTASGQKGVPVWKQLIGSFFSLGTVLSVGVTLLTVYGKEIGDFISSLFKGSKALEEFKEAQKRLNDVKLKGNQSAQDEITKLKTLYSITQNTTLSLTQRKEAAAELQKQYPGYLANISQENILNGNAKEAYDKLTLSILATARAKASQDLITQNSQKQLENEQKIADLQREQLENKRKLQQAQKIANISGNGTGAGIGGASTGNVYASGELLKASAKIKENNKAQYDLNTQNIKLSKENEKLAENINKEIANGGKVTSDTAKAMADAAAKAEAEFAQMLISRKEAWEKINALDNEYSRKSFTKDEEEKQALVAKFADFRKIIEKENIKIAEFNKKNKKKIDPLDIGRVNSIQTRAEEDLAYRQKTEHLKNKLEKEKLLYADFESYRDRLGEEAAKARFGKSIDTTKTYLENLQAEFDKLKNTKGLNRVEQERFKYLEVQLKQEENLQNKQYDDLLKSLQDYEQQRAVLTETYNRQRAEIIEKGNSDAAISLDVQYQADLESLDDANLKKLDAYKALFGGIEEMSRTAAKTVIADGKKMLTAAVNAGKISKQEASNIKKQLDRSEKSLAERLPDGLSKVASGLREAAGLIGKFDEGAARAVNTVANLADSAASIIQGFASGNPFAIIGGAVSAVSTLVDLFDRSDDRRADNEARQQAALDKTKGFIASLNRLLELQAKIIDKSLGSDKILAYRRQIGLITKDISDTIKNLNSLDLKAINTLRGVSKYNIKLANLNEILNSGGGRPDRDGRTNPAVQTSLDTIDKVIEANRANIEALYAAIESGRLVGNIDQLRELLATYEQLESQLDNYRIKLQEIVTGTTFSNIVDTIAEGFRNGLSSAQDFADSFEDMLKNSIIQSLKLQALEKPLKAFYDQLAADSESGGSLDATEIAKLKELYNSIIASAGKQFDNLKSLTGIDFDKPGGAEKSGTLSGAIRGITAEQADLLAGQFGGQRLATLETNVLLRIHNQTGMDQLASMRQSALMLVEIASNTGRSAKVEENYLPMLSYLKEISNNMVSNRALRGQGG